MIPGLEAGRERAEISGNLARRDVPHLMARVARLGFQQDVLVGDGPFRNLQEAQPIICGIHLRRRAAVRRDNGFQIHVLPGSGRDARRIHQPIAAHEHLVVRLWQVRHHVAALIVGDHHSGELRRQIGCFGDHPHARLGTNRARHDAADVISVDRDRRARSLLCADPGE